MGKRAARAVFIIFVALAGVALYFEDNTFPEEKRLSVAQALSGGDISGFARAYTPRPLQFPDDHGPHPEFRNEWWYFTGNVDDIQGKHLGFQLTFFRIGMSPDPVERSSAWGTREIYMAHFAVSDVASGRFYHFERFSRGAIGLADTKADPFRVWLENWQAASAGGNLFPMRLTAEEKGVKVDLVLGEGKPVVLQGDEGLSRKSREPGNASYYYSISRFPISGVITIGANTHRVEGSGWFDREWGTSALSAEQIGWDWFALQLSDGREVMFYRLRLKTGGDDPMSGGKIIFPNGSTAAFGIEEVKLEILDYWISPHSGVRYPARWRIVIPNQGIDVLVMPYLADQEMRLSVRYWEGAVAVKGESAGKPVQGHGYVELAGY